MVTRIVFLILIAAYVTSSAQVMNVRKWRQSERDTLDNALALVDEGFYARAFPYFEHLLGNHPDELFLKYSYAKCALHRGDRQHEALAHLREVYAKNKKVPDILYDMALAAYHRYQFDEAERLLVQYTSGKRVPEEGRSNADRLRRYIGFAKQHLAQPGRSRVSALGDAINSEFNEHTPAINASGSMLTFAQAAPRSTGGLQYEELGEDIRSFTYFDDVMVSYRKDRVFLPSVPLDSLNTPVGDKLVALSPDGKNAIVQLDVGDGHGDLFGSHFNGYYFVPTYRLNGAVNGYSGEYHATRSPDGQTIIFSSDRPGGFGGRDLYRATLVNDTLWTNIQNLGDSVNTREDEDTPFLFGDGRTLFFSSKGRNTMGGYDIFMTTMNADTTFSGTRNLGYPVNGTSDDVGFVLAADGRNGYFSSERKEGMGLSDIYHVDAVFPVLPGPVYVATGKITGPQGPVRAEVLVERITDSRTTYVRTQSDSVTGEYLVTLSPDEKYEVWCSHPAFQTASLVIDVTGLTAYTEKDHHVQLQPATLAKLSAPAITLAPAAQTSAITSSVAAITKPPVMPAGKSSEPWPDKDGFIPLTLLQQKAMRYMQKYGEVSAPGLQFCVQVAAVKGRANMFFPNLSRYGKVEKLQLYDGFTRITVGGKFSTLSKAFQMNKKAIMAGEDETFVIALYHGKRVQFEELEKMGVFK